MATKKITVELEETLLDELSAKALKIEEVLPYILKKYLDHLNKKSAPTSSLDECPTLAEVLAHYREGPQTGIFTDGSARPNPGPGGWGYVWVKEGSIQKQEYGHADDTTNNRMEYTAIIKALEMLPEDAELEIFTDSNLLVQTLTQWAKNWEKRGWKRKEGEIANLELVKKAYALSQAHPKVKISWIKAHNGWLWNEYADSLSTAWSRKTL